MKPPKCPHCGVSEWQHLCGGRVVLEEVVTNPVTKRGGRPRKGEQVMSAAERMRLMREKRKPK